MTSRLPHIALRSVLMGLVAALLCLAAPAEEARAASAQQIDADVDAALHPFYREVGGARELVRDAAAVLVFPSVVKAGMGLGGECREGALRRQG